LRGEARKAKIAPMRNFHTGFTCTACGAHYPTNQIEYTCPKCGGNMDAAYDYATIRKEVDPRQMVSRADRSAWHYAELLPRTAPSGERHTPLAEFGASPLYRAGNLERELGIRKIWLKDDGQLPSNSFKDRASSMVVAQAIATKRETICVASTGNAASALALMCAGRSDVRAVIFVPQGTPEGKLVQSLIYGAHVYIVKGSYNDAVEMASAACQRFGWYNRSTGTNPYTREGKKTAAFEICEQLALADGAAAAFRAPDVMIVPVGDGNIISGIHKGYKDLFALGWIDRVPKFIGATATQAPSLFRAWQSGGEQCQLAPSTTLASGISVDIPADGAMALRAVRDTGGALIECEDEELLEGIAALARKTAVFAEPSAAASYVALVKARAQGLIGSADEVVLQLTGNGLKDTKSALRAAGAPRVVSSLDEV